MAVGKNSRPGLEIDIDLLSEPILGFRWAGYVLFDDLRHLAQVINAPDAVVFYYGMVLESLSAAEVVDKGAGEPGGSMFANTQRLTELGVLPTRCVPLFHTLRRLSNEARHAHRSIDRSEAALAVAVLVRILEWFFHPETAQAAFRVDDDVEQALRCLESDDLDDLRRVWGSGSTTLRASQAFISLYAEALIRLGAPPLEALKAARHGLELHQGDLRLRQLEGWALRNDGDLDRAIEIFEQLAEEHSDPESLGFLAGSYRRRWHQTGSRADLEKAANRYGQARAQSRNRDTYPGVNAASMMLLRGEQKRAAQLAREVLRLFESRQTCEGTIAFSGYWDEVTFAERLLAGDHPRARRHYRRAFTAHEKSVGQVRSTSEQLALLLSALGVNETVEEWLTGPTTPYDPRPPNLALPPKFEALVEGLATRVHHGWARGRLDEGWTFGGERSDDVKTHPSLVRYEELPESEREYDRVTARVVLAGLLELRGRLP